jgi:hypothetical protein
MEESMAIRLFNPLLLLSLLAFGCTEEATGLISDEETLGESTAALTDDAVRSTELLTVEVPAAFNVPFSGLAAAEFPRGLPLSIGSGIRLAPRAGRGCGCEHTAARSGFSLMGLSDRGPNGDAPDYLDAAGVKHASKAYLVPSFTPELVTIDVSPRRGARVTSRVELRTRRTKAVGVPPSSLTTEVGLSDSLGALPSSAAGMDPEGIDFDAAGDAWVCEEYGPSLMKVRPRSGEIVSRLVPGSGLPTLLASRQVNRGFEGVAVSPSGKVYGMVQSTLDIDGKTKGSAQFIRLVEYDPRTGETRMFAYPHDVPAYKKSGDAKMGDLVALDNTHFLTIEQGKDKDGNLRNLVYEFDIAPASDLSGVTLTSGANAGKELEYGTLAEVSADVRFATKSLLLDLRAYGWTAEKAEGLTLVDERTLVVANDQDFGATSVVDGDATGGTDPTKYVVDSAGVLTFNGAASSGRYAIHAQPSDAQKSMLLVVELQKPLAGYCAR